MVSLFQNRKNREVFSARLDFSAVPSYFVCVLQKNYFVVNGGEIWDCQP